MRRFSRVLLRAIMAATALAFATASSAQTAQGGTPWMLMQDGIVFAEYDHQGGPRGGDEFVVPNWWMGMASKGTPHGQVTFTGMLSLDPAAVRARGYGELFQEGEAFNGLPIINRQHPHDFFMQLSAAWRLPLTDSTALSIMGGPAGEAALGPTTFMHRASASENPTAPLTHHTFDSTHVSFGVATASLDHGPWTIQGSIFNGREPDQDRWDFDFGRLDSYSGRVFFRPSYGWELQASTGHLTNPETLEPGNVQRTTASVSWTHISGGDLDAVTAGYGRNDTDQGARQGTFVEGTHRRGANIGYFRLEALQVETALLLTDQVPPEALAGAHSNVVTLTVGAVHDLAIIHGFETGVGADFTVYHVPAALEAAYGSHPISLHLFVRVRVPAGSMGRMWNMRMGKPMHQL
jgi:hypothetical protein